MEVYIVTAVVTWLISAVVVFIMTDGLFDFEDCVWWPIHAVKYLIRGFCRAVFSGWKLF